MAWVLKVSGRVYLVDTANLPLDALSACGAKTPFERHAFRSGEDSSRGIPSCWTCSTTFLAEQTPVVVPDAT